MMDVPSSSSYSSSLAFSTSPASAPAPASLFFVFSCTSSCSSRSALYFALPIESYAYTDVVIVQLVTHITDLQNKCDDDVVDMLLSLAFVAATTQLAKNTCLAQTRGG